MTTLLGFTAGMTLATVIVAIRNNDAIATAIFLMAAVLSAAGAVTL